MVVAFDPSRRNVIGTVQRAIDAAKLRGVSVAPAATKENLAPGGGY
jgi:hypothetical protein